MDTLLLDLRYALRRLLRTPGFTVTAVATLALGIGANSALLSILNGLFWDPPATVGEPEGLTWLSLVEPYAVAGVSYGDYLAFRDRADVYEELAVASDRQVALGGGDGAPERLTGEMVSGNYFSVLRMQPGRGRLLSDADDVGGGESSVAVISHDLWNRRFGGRDDVVGREIVVNGSTLTIVGVAPEGFRGITNVEESIGLWMPMSVYSQVGSSWVDPLELEYGTRPFMAFGRLRPGVTIEQAEVPLQGMLRAWTEEFPESYQEFNLRIFPFRGVFGPVPPGGGVVQYFAIPISVTLLVLLIACGNVANLLLARASSRHREIAVRTAIGASRSHIVRQLLVESLVVAMAGGAAGLILAGWGLEIFFKFAALPFSVPVSLDGRVVALTLVLSFLTAITFGLAPALRASRTELTASLKGDSGSGRQRSRPQRFLVAGQLALSFVMLVSAGLLLRHMGDIFAADRRTPARDEVLTMTFDLGSQGYSPDERRAYQQQMVERLSSIGAVEAVSLTQQLSDGQLLPLGRIEVDGRVVSEGGFDPTIRGGLREIWPDFFETIAIPLRGRDFTAADRVGTPPVAIINETAARVLWPNVDPIGRSIRLGRDTMPVRTVIGVVADAALDRGRDGVEPVVYTPDLQRPEATAFTTVLIRTRGSSRDFAPSLRQVAASIDPNIAFYDVRTLGESLDRRSLEARLGSSLLSLFGALALGLAMIGLYGVVAYTVVLRTREMGIRIALGATRGQILSLFGRDTLRVAGYGVIAGLLMAGAASQILSSMVQGLEPADALPVAGTAILLLGVAVLTSLIPARRATRVDPIVALRAE